MKIINLNTYSPQERLLRHTQQLGGDIPEELIASDEYDALGQLISKQVGGQDVQNNIGYQKVDYRYNIRGWLKSINDISSLDQPNDPLDLFAFKINYNTVENDVNGQVQGLYNGNISETFWRTSSDNNLRKYGYQYDGLNRLLQAIYQKPDYNMPVTNMYNESLSYDKNGNIQTLQRNGDFDWDASTSPPLVIDDLIYRYDIINNPNQLMSVSDSTNNPKGFVDGTNTGDDYTYDANGNMTHDLNKLIENISYNHLNLPVLITFTGGNTIAYLYNAIGQKVRKTVKVDGNSLETYYLDGF